jgi:hypothetical protein
VYRFERYGVFKVNHSDVLVSRLVCIRKCALERRTVVPLRSLVKKVVQIDEAIGSNDVTRIRVVGNVVKDVKGFHVYKITQFFIGPIFEFQYYLQIKVCSFQNILHVSMSILAVAKHDSIALSSSSSSHSRQNMVFRHTREEGECVLRNIEWDVIVKVWDGDELVMSTEDVLITKGIRYPFADAKVDANGRAVDNVSPTLTNAGADVPDVGLFHGTLSREISNAQDYLKGSMWQNQSVRPNAEVITRDLDPTPWYQIDVKPLAGVNLSCFDLSLLVVLQGKTVQDSVQWTCKLSRRNHNNMPFERNSSVSCSLDMNCEDGFHSAVSYYNYFPRTWNGICIKMYSPSLERVFFQ